MTCNRTGQVHRYHDGELAPADQKLVEAHLRECAQCRALLTELQRLSALLSVVARADIPAEALGRLRGAWYTTADRGVLRAASWLTAAAAAVLIGVLLTWPADRADPGIRPPIWGTLAVMPPSQVQDDNSADLVVMAQWMADDLSAGQTR